MIQRIKFHLYFTNQSKVEQSKGSDFLICINYANIYRSLDHESNDTKVRDETAFLKYTLTVRNSNIYYISHTS